MSRGPRAQVRHIPIVAPQARSLERRSGAGHVEALKTGRAEGQVLPMTRKTQNRDAGRREPDRQGVVRYAYVGEAPDDRPAIDRVLEEVRKVPAQ